MRVARHSTAAAVASLVIACGAPRDGERPPSAIPSSPAPTTAPAIGEKAMPFTRKALTGTTIAIPSKSDVTVLFFFATWSAPDMKLVTHMEEIARVYPDAAVFAICVDDDDKTALAAATRNGATYPVAWDANHELATAYKLDTVPLVFVLDAGGVIRFIHRGYHDGENDEIEAEVASLTKSDVCARPLPTSDGRACFRQCDRIAKREAACGVGPCRARCR